MEGSNTRAWAEFVSRYYGDASFAKRVDADPTGCLRTAGIPMPEGKEIKMIKDTDKTAHFVLPSPTVGNASADDLEKVFGGNCSTCCNTTCCD